MPAKKTTPAYNVGAFFLYWLLLLWVLYPLLNQGLYVIDDFEVLGAVPQDPFAWKSLEGIFLANFSLALPLTNLTYVFDFQLFHVLKALGLTDSPLPILRIIQMAWAALAATLIFHFSTMRLNAGSLFLKFFCFLAGLFFLLHPMHAHTHVWIASRKDILVFVFCFLSFLAFDKNHWKTGVVFLVLAFLSKLSAYGFFFWLIFALALKENLRRNVLLLGSLAALAFLLFPLLISRSVYVTESHFLPHQTFGIFFVYLKHFFWPHPILQFYPPPDPLPWPLSFLFWITAILALGTWVWAAHRKKISVAVFDQGILALAFILPYCVVVPIHLFIYNPYAYGFLGPLTLLVFFLLIKMIESKSPVFRWALVIGVFGVITLFAFQHRVIAKNFYDPLTAYQNDLRRNPLDLNHYLRLGQIADAMGEKDLALQTYKNALDLYVEKKSRIPIIVFNPYLALALKENSQLHLSHIDQLAGANSNGFYCKQLVQALKQNPGLSFNPIKRCSRHTSSAN